MKRWANWVLWSGCGLFLFNPAVAIVPWGAETQGEMSQVHSLEPRFPWAIVGVLLRNLRSMPSPAPPELSTEASTQTDLSLTIL